MVACDSALEHEAMHGWVPATTSVLITAREVDRHTEAYKRITSAGFTIGEFVGDGIFDCYVPFVCVCGKTEYLSTQGSHITKCKYWDTGYGYELIDVAAILESLGSVSEEHLREDGYSEDEIKRIRSAYQ